MPTRASVVAVCHGGRPMPIFNDLGHAALIKSIKNTVRMALKGIDLEPRNAQRTTCYCPCDCPLERTSPDNQQRCSHSLYYDYGSFLREACALKYLALGSPDVVDEVFAALEEAGFKPEMDRERGWDHGVFVPMIDHYEMGKVLGRLRDSGVAIVGSGMPTMYNLRTIFSGKMNEEWVGSKEAHFVRGEEHYLLLVVCAGTRGVGEGGAFGNDTIGTKKFTYYWKQDLARRGNDFQMDSDFG
ncbi:Extradiol ring-cleavage dioxygenase, class III enzyme, subunit B [Leptodontidium sp. 2 PMI_412]|nr:Extradiol ring-cleavage dioxygenase, class III enzyme, subunit B [Leptodontidium sp. 2 PMI_412]